MKKQVLFSLKNNEKVFIDVVCCSHDWRFRVKPLQQIKNQLLKKLSQL